MSALRPLRDPSFCSSEFNNSFLDSLGSDEDSGNEDVFDMEYTEAEAEELKRNAEVRLVTLPVFLLLLLFRNSPSVEHSFCLSAAVNASPSSLLFCSLFLPN